MSDTDPSQECKSLSMRSRRRLRLVIRKVNG